jgi:hypothetical protein
MRSWSLMCQDREAPKSRSSSPITRGHLEWFMNDALRGKNFEEVDLTIDISKMREL